MRWSSFFFKNSSPGASTPANMLFLIKSTRLLMLPFVLLGLSASEIGCSSNSATAENYLFGMGLLPTLEHSGEIFTIPPSFAVVTISENPNLYTTFSDSVTLSAYTDSNCSLSANSVGTLSVLPTNPVSFDSGAAIFPGVSFAWNGDPYLEGYIYLKGSLNTHSGVYYCSTAIPVIQRFMPNSGYLLSGTRGATDSSTTADTVFDHGAIHRIDSVGRYVVAGISRTTAGAQQATIWRYLPNGVLDAAFNNNTGHVSFGSVGAAGATVATDTVNDLQIDSNGNYVLAGSSANSSGGTALALWRYTSGGTLDTTFGENGVVTKIGCTGGTTSATGNDVAQSLQIDSTGNLIVVGSSYNGTGTELFIAKYKSNGTLDASFGTSGIYHFGTTGAAGATGSSENDVGYSLQIDSSGNYVIAGSSENSSGGTEMAMWKVKSSGIPDTTWGSNGSFHLGGIAGETVASSYLDVGYSLIIDNQGFNVVAGTSRNASGGSELALWRYTTSGTLDSTFNNSGYVVFGSTGAAGATDENENDIGYSIIQDSNSKYVIAGVSGRSDSLTNEMTLWRYTSSGALDTSFNSSKGYVHFGDINGNLSAARGTTEQARSVRVDSVGTYTLVGWSAYGSSQDSGHAMAIWRFLPSGGIDK